MFLMRMESIKVDIITDIVYSISKLRKGDRTMRHELLKTQSNDVFNTLIECDLNPSDFEWVEGVFYTESTELLTKGNYINNTCPKLILRNNPNYYFQFELYTGSHHYTCCPGAETVEGEGHTGE